MNVNRGNNNWCLYKNCEGNCFIWSDKLHDPMVDIDSFWRNIYMETSKKNNDTAS